MHEGICPLVLIEDEAADGERETDVAAEPGADRGRERHALCAHGDPRLGVAAQQLSRVLPVVGGAPGAVLALEPLDFAPITEDERTRLGNEAGRIAARWTIVFCQVEASQRWRAALEGGGLAYRRTCVWVKPDAQPQLSGDRPAMGYESLVCAHARVDALVVIVDCDS